MTHDAADDPRVRRPALIPDAPACAGCADRLTAALDDLFGVATLWMAVFADTGVALLVILNGLRLLRA